MESKYLCDAADVEQLAVHNQMKQLMAAAPAARSKMNSSALGRAMRLDERVPPFHHEFSKDGR